MTPYHPRHPSESSLLRTGRSLHVWTSLIHEAHLWIDSWEEELEAVDQVVAEGAVEKEIQQQWRHHSVLGVLSGGHIGPSRKWTMHRRAELENKIGVPLSVRFRNQCGPLLEVLAPCWNDGC